MSQQIYQVLAEIRPENDFSSSTDFIRDGLLDSFDILILVTRIEEMFSVAIDGTEVTASNFSSAESIGNLITRSKKTDAF
jgi:acyl carrier protein